MRNKIILSFFSAILLSLGWLGLSGISLLGAFVPLLWIADTLGDKKKDSWKMFGYVALALGVWSAVNTWWIWYAAPIGAILSVTNTWLLFGGTFMVFFYVSKRAPKPLAYTLLVSMWIAMEMLYTYGEVSFPWLMLGNGFTNDIKLVQWYEYTGIFGGSLWVLVSNILIYEAIKVKNRSKIIIATIWTVVPMVVSMVMFFSYNEKGEVVKVQVIQPNIDPYKDKFTLSQELQNKKMLTLLEQAPKDVDLIVMPETAINEKIVEGYLDRSPTIKQYRNFLKENYQSAEIIVGAMTVKYYTDENLISETARSTNNPNLWYDVYNSALAIDTTSVVDIHHKSMLVIGVEKMPYKRLLNILRWLIVDLGGTTGGLGVDDVRTVVELSSGVRLGTAICYESIYGAYFTEFIQNGAEVMVVITNDGWWGDSMGYRHHLSYAKLRAIENRRAIARSGNTGISAIINQRGEIVEQTEGWVEASLNGEIKSNDKITIYSIYGDYIGRIATFTMALCLLYYISYRFKKRSHLV